jgi:sugar lactone lactonase YvrE/thiol-disulfide isomerase/thioredoxin
MIAGSQKVRGHLLNTTLSSDVNGTEKEAAVANYLDQTRSGDEKVYFQGFPDALEWFNCSSLSLDDQLKGKLLVLDFFTYCCINCMHILPDLHALEEHYKDTDGLVIIGVHSAKFDNEKDSLNILNAILRYDINHPVVNDSDATVWHQMDVACWPTVMVIAPDCQVLHQFIGEGHWEKMKCFVGAALKYYSKKGLLNKSALPMSLAKNDLPPSPLKFPGKVCVSNDGKMLYVSDTGHHRILVIDQDGLVVNVIGGQSQGFKDGNYATACFHSPQGLCWRDGLLYVSDTENHALRKIDMKAQKVMTVVGTGQQGSDHEGGKVGVEQEISSPWDLCVGALPGSSDDSQDGLYIAMAGSHQVWTYFLKDGPWLKRSSYCAGTCVRFAGSGAEENRNNSYPHKAAFAQPSGLTVASQDGAFLYVADSESSSIRSVSLRDGATKAVVGGAVDPMNLFAFGDIDGKGVAAKLQHPLGVAWNSKDNLLYVADSYNHKIKYVNPLTRESMTLCGNGLAGSAVGSLDQAQFSEPGGLSISPDGCKLYVADTNNHSIKVIDLQSKTVSQLHIREAPLSVSKPSTAGRKRVAPRGTAIIKQPALCIKNGIEMTIQLSVQLPEGCHFTEGATSRWQIVVPEDSPIKILGDYLGSIVPYQSVQITIVADHPVQSGNLSFQVEAVVYFCEETGVCRVQGAVFEVPVVMSSSAGLDLSSDYTMTVECKV